MIPYTLVLKPGLVIHSIYNGYGFWGRPSFAIFAMSSPARSVPTGTWAQPTCAHSWNRGDRSCVSTLMRDAKLPWPAPGQGEDANEGAPLGAWASRMTQMGTALSQVTSEPVRAAGKRRHYSV